LASSVTEARKDLERLKIREHMLFISDRLLGHELPEWVTKSAHTTDGHLLMLAKSNGARLVTLDQLIPDAEIIRNFAETRNPPLADLAMRCRCSC
jgi:hypothetical protein